MTEKPLRIALKRFAADPNHPGAWILSSYSFGSGPVDLVLSAEEMRQILGRVQQSYIANLGNSTEPPNYPVLEVTDVTMAHGEIVNGLMLRTNGSGDLVAIVPPDLRPKMKREIDRLVEADEERSKGLQ